MIKKIFSASPLGMDFLAIIRIFAGVLILLHGKMVFDAQSMNGMAQSLGNNLGMPFPVLMAYLAKGSEFFGGLLLALGLFTRFASIPLIITMLVAVFGAHHGKISGEAEHAFLFLLLFVAFFFIGSGKWSIDHLIKNGFNKKSF